MNGNALTRQYSHLTPEERFRLILAAGARGDETEQNRLVRAGHRLTMSMPDHSPYGHAFNELSLLVFIELVEEAARYQDAFHQADEDEELDDRTGQRRNRANEESEEQRSRSERLLDLALAAGYVLRTKTEGWKQFCERLSVPPFNDLEEFPGFDRLQRSLALAEKAAFEPEGFLRWLNRIRPKDEPEAKKASLTVEGVAKASAEMFRSRVAWWGG
jgi:hypothetical protein